MAARDAIMIDRLERAARLAVTSAERLRLSGHEQTASELDTFAELFEQSATLIREMRVGLVPVHAMRLDS